MYVIQGKNKQHFNKNVSATALIYLCIYMYICMHFTCNGM